MKTVADTKYKTIEHNGRQVQVMEIPMNYFTIDQNDDGCWSVNAASDQAAESTTEDNDNDNDNDNNNGEQTMNKIQIYVDNLGDNANFELYEQIAERVFGHYASVVVFNFPGVDKRGNIDEEWFSELLADVWDQYINDPFFSN